jgi:hypothetical protein
MLPWVIGHRHKGTNSESQSTRSCSGTAHSPMQGRSVPGHIKYLGRFGSVINSVLSSSVRASMVINSVDVRNKGQRGLAWV